jgi:hypothetical protein
MLRRMLRRILRLRHSTVRPGSVLDVGLSILLASVLVAIWHMGDFHTRHHSDTAIYSLVSLYRWTAFIWEYDHIGAFLPLLARPIHRPYLNLFVLSAVNSFASLYGFALWANLISLRRLTLTAGGLWSSVALLLVMPKAELFQNAALNYPWALGFFFAALFTCLLQWQLRKARLREMAATTPALFVLAFLTVYVSKIALIPLLIVTPGLIWESIPHTWPVRFDKNLLVRLALLLCVILALLIYQWLEQSAEFKSGLTLNPANIPQALPHLLRRWLLEELNSPWLLLAAILFIYNPLARHRETPLLTYLAAGILCEAVLVAASSRAEQNGYPGLYLTDLAFLLVLVIVTACAQLAQRIGYWRHMVVPFSLILNAWVWHSFTPTTPFAAMDRTIGASTAAMVQARCDVLIGDYWKVWPAVLAVNDYYYREGILDPRTGKVRLVMGITYRARPVEDLWREQLNWPDVTICAFTDDELGFRQSLKIYAPDIALLLTPYGNSGPFAVYKLENRRLPELGLEFDLPIPGPGWHGVEHTSGGKAFQWMSGTTSTVILPLAIDHDLIVRFRVLPPPAPDILPSLTVTVNDHLILFGSRNDGDGVICSAAIPSFVLRANPRYTALAFHINHTIVPGEILGNGDPRALGLAFDWIQIERGP